MRIIGSKDGYNLVANQYREYYDLLDSFDWDQAQKMIVGHLTELQTGASIADLGCGDGRVIGRVHKTCQKLGIAAQCYGFDIASAMVKRAQKRLGTEITFCELDFNKQVPPVFVHKFDLVIAMFFLVHQPSIDEFLRQSARLMTKGGTLIFNSIRQPNGFSYGEGGQKFFIEWFDHRAHQVVAAIEKSHFEIIEHVELEDSEVFAVRLEEI